MKRRAATVLKRLVALEDHHGAGKPTVDTVRVVAAKALAL